MTIPTDSLTQAERELACSIINRFGRGGPMAEPATLTFFSADAIIRNTANARHYLAPQFEPLLNGLLAKLTPEPAAPGHVPNGPLDQAYLEGERARNDGLPITACPYKAIRALGAGWRRGWRAGA